MIINKGFNVVIIKYKIMEIIGSSINTKVPNIPSLGFDKTEEGYVFKSNLGNLRFKDENELVNISEDIKAIDMRIASVIDGGKYTHFKKIRDDAVAKYEQIYEKYRITEEEYKSLKNSIEVNSIGDSMHELSDMAKKGIKEIVKKDFEKKEIRFLDSKKKMDEAEKEKSKAEADFAPLHEKYENLLQLRKYNEEKLILIKEEIRQRALLSSSANASLESD